jgi:dephospho-CoA kinase
MFGALGCGVIDSDRLAHEVLEQREVKRALREWVGEGVFDGEGRVSRRALGGVVFGDGEKIRRLNELVHPRVGLLRDELMKKYLGDEGIKGIVWDTPLLVEAGLAGECDAVVYVDSPLELRRKRVAEKRGWKAEEHEKREKLQNPLDKKAELADYCIDNSGDEATTLSQVQRVLSQLLARND